MITIHSTFVCKPGNASKLAKMFKEWADTRKGTESQVMTDMTGQFHRVIMAESYESLGDYEKAMETMGQSVEEKKMMKKFKDMNEMYISGSREIFKVW